MRVPAHNIAGARIATRVILHRQPRTFIKYALKLYRSYVHYLYSTLARLYYTEREAYCIQHFKLVYTWCLHGCDSITLLQVASLHHYSHNQLQIQQKPTILHN